MQIFNDKKYKTRRQELRNKATDAERKLWYYLKGKQLNDFKFRRQAGFGYYIVDFYCPAAKLVIEVDGGQHFEPSNVFYDEERTKYLESLGLRVIRFTNREVQSNVEGVLLEIVKYL